MTDKTFYIKASGEIYVVVAKSPEEAKKFFKSTYGLKKMPMGSIITSNRNSDFLK